MINYFTFHCYMYFIYVHVLFVGFELLLLLLVMLWSIQKFSSLYFPRPKKYKNTTIFLVFPNTFYYNWKTMTFSYIFPFSLQTEQHFIRSFRVLLKNKNHFFNWEQNKIYFNCWKFNWEFLKKFFENVNFYRFFYFVLQVFLSYFILIRKI